MWRLTTASRLPSQRNSGRRLGPGLIALHDRLEDPGGELRELLGVDDTGRFLGSLWKLLAAGVGKTDDPLRREFLRRLHGNQNGLSAWMGARRVVPSGLGAPFPAVLPAIEVGMKVDVAGDIAEPDLCAALGAIADPEVASVLGRRCMVSREVAQLLRPLQGTGGFVRLRMGELNLDDLLSEVVEGWGRQLTPEHLQALRPLAGEGVWNSVATASHGARWRSGLVAGAADGTTQPLRNLLLPTPPSDWEPEDEDAVDELRRAALAPEGSVLAPSFVECAEDWKVFRWLRERHRVDAVAVAEWYPELLEARRGRAIHYLLHGNLGNDVLRHLVAPSRRPSWLRNYESVRALLDGLGEEAWRCEGLLGSLFPDRFAPVSPPEPPVVADDGFFERLVTWWDDDAERDSVVRAYEKRVWPAWLRAGDVAGSLRAGSADHWLALLVLGACRGIGRTNDDQHRSFLELARGEGVVGRVSVARRHGPVDGDAAGVAGRRAREPHLPAVDGPVSGDLPVQSVPGRLPTVAAVGGSKARRPVSCHVAPCAACRRGIDRNGLEVRCAARAAASRSPLGAEGACASWGDRWRAPLRGLLGSVEAGGRVPGAIRP